MNLNIVFEDSIDIIITPVKEGFKISYRRDEYVIKTGETLSLNGGDLYLEVISEKEGEK